MSGDLFVMTDIELQELVDTVDNETATHRNRLIKEMAKELLVLRKNTKYLCEEINSLEGYEPKED